MMLCAQPLTCMIFKIRNKVEVRNKIASLQKKLAMSVV